MTDKRRELLVQTAQDELAEHDVSIGLDALRAAATRYEACGRPHLAHTIRDLVEVIRKAVVG